MVSIPPARGTSPARAGVSAVVAVLGAAALLLVLVTWAASIGPDRVVSGGHLEPVNPIQPTATTSAPPPPNPLEEARRRHPDEQPGWVGPVAFGLEILTLGVLLFLAFRLLSRLQQAWAARRHHRRREGVEEVEFQVLGSAEQVTEVMTEDAVEQRVLLEVAGEPRNAIVECWHRFEQQAERAGVERRAWQTTSEFVLGLLDLVGADQGAVAELAELYREARFSDHPMTDAHRSRALESLDAIHRSLRPRALR